MCLYNEFMPLRQHLGRDTNNFDLFREFKIKATAEEFCSLNECEFLTRALEECYALRYDEQPDYAKIKFTLQKALLEEHLLPGGTYYKINTDGLE
jgi:hypothetical protein